MSLKCTHYPWSLIDDLCPDCEKLKPKCCHYPYVHIDDDCLGCDQKYNTPNRKFYCSKCYKYTRHVVKSSKLCCNKCHNGKVMVGYGKCAFISSSNSGNDLSKNYHMGEYGRRVYNNITTKCKECYINNVNYITASFWCPIEGVRMNCVDTYRPLCTKCHMAVCEDKTHKKCVQI